LLDQDRASASLNLAFGQVAVADDSPMAVVIENRAEALDMLLDLGLQGDRKHLSR
jgi:hypothetical protein